jgi:hypothetical protein
MPEKSKILLIFFYEPVLPDGIFYKPKIPIWVNFLGSCKWKILVYYIAIWSTYIHILRLFGIFCCHLVYFMVIRYIFPVLVCCTKKNLATPLESDQFWMKKGADPLICDLENANEASWLSKC